MKKKKYIFFTDVSSLQVMLGAAVEKYYYMKLTCNEQPRVIKPSQVILLQQLDCLSFCERAEELRQAIIQAQFSKVRFYWGCQVKKKMCGCIYMNLHQLNAS